jgi:DNA-binding NarL/FixJ family response regulator
MPIRILIADDHPIVRDGLRGVLGTQPDLQVVAEAATGAEVLALGQRHQPDVVLLDLGMPEMDGVAVLPQLRAAGLPARVIVFTAFDTDERILEAVRAGAHGYLLKGVPREELFNAVRVVHGGGSLLQPVVAAKLLRQVSRGREEIPNVLTRRELEVLRLLVHGRLNKEIGVSLAISERTVKFHVRSILNKLGASNRTEAVALATRRGLVELDAVAADT